MTKKYYIGLMSGTSCDGVDAAIVDENITLHHHHYLPYPRLFQDTLRQALRLLRSDQAITISAVNDLSIEIANFFSQAVNELLKKSAVNKADICAIGSHGHTIYHQPKHYSLQIGHPALIAEKTAITVVADFRVSDIAAGGEGAPLTPAFHQFILKEKNGNIINLGGIANITIKRGDNITGFDSGPANALLDAWIQKNQRLNYDENGQWAKQGSVDETLLNKLLSDAYFKQAVPKSTGTEYFNLHWLNQYLSGDEPAQNVQRTLVELSAQSIINAVDSSLPIWLCGGGVHNQLLFERLKALSPQPLEGIAELGAHPDYLEACAFAYFAQQTLQKKPVISTTHQNGRRILGGIYYATNTD